MISEHIYDASESASMRDAARVAHEKGFRLFSHGEMLCEVNISGRVLGRLAVLPREASQFEVGDIVGLEGHHHTGKVVHVDMVGVCVYVTWDTDHADSRPEAYRPDDLFIVKPA